MEVAFLANVVEEKKMEMWVCLLGLSLDLYNNTILWSVGATLGIPLKVDCLTSISRGQFARIYVELDFSKNLSQRSRFIIFSFVSNKKGFILFVSIMEPMVIVLMIVL